MEGHPISTRQYSTCMYLCRDVREESEESSEAVMADGRVAKHTTFEQDVDDEDEVLQTRSKSTYDGELLQPFMGLKVRRRSSMYRLFKGDYVEVASNEHIVKLLSKQGDKQVLFAENLVKVNRKSKIVRIVLLITDVALYTLDAEFFRLKRRIPLQAIQRVCLSEAMDNFFAMIVPSEYDCLFASTRKTEIVTILVDATKKLSDSGESLDISFSNSFDYYMDSEHVRRVIFEEVEGGIKTKFVDI